VSPLISGEHLLRSGTVLNAPGRMASSTRRRPRRLYSCLAVYGDEGVEPDPGGDTGELSESTLVLSSLASAIRDEAVFDHPHEFGIDRTEADNLIFGFGSKFCPGSLLARQQMACAIAVLLERLADIEVVDADEPCGGVLLRCERLVAHWRPA
jgi:cytochrome P450